MSERKKLDDRVNNPLANVKLSGPVEFYELKEYQVYANNKPDAEKVLKAFLQSQDVIVKMKSEPWGYTAYVRAFVARDE